MAIGIVNTGGESEIRTGTGAHNSTYRGADLGSAVTERQYAAIADGSFDDLYIGDYWTIGGTVWRIAAFDYYYQTGDTACTEHHVTLVPDTVLYNHVMNDTAVITGAYVGSKMYTGGLIQAKDTINAAFGQAHILNHRQYLADAITNDITPGGNWYDSTVELMTEQNVYGCKIASPANGYTVDKSQYPLFAFRPDLIANRQHYWLRDAVPDAYFARVHSFGVAGVGGANYEYGVRSAFSIIG